MKVKWHISALILLLTILGVVNQQQISVPNQEIVLQFSNAEVTTEETQTTIAIVKKQLQDLGADNIQVSEEEKGRLKITYYSDADIASIKETLSKEKKVDIDYSASNQNNKPTEFPFDNVISYNLDVFEIQKANDVELGFDGYILEQKPESDRVLIPNVYFSFIEVDVREDNKIVKVAYKVSRNNAIAIENISYIIPEVRAGPNTCGDS